MREQLLGYLACPGCQTDLRCNVDSRQGDEIESGELVCAGCGHAYPILRGVPRFSMERLAADESSSSTIDAFGWEWQEFPVLHDMETYRSQFADWIQPIRPEFLEGKVVLDAGCGMGRFSRAGHSFGARLVLAVDASDAVEAARENTRDTPEIQVVQADLCNLPLRRGPEAQIDFAFSIGVLHHLSDPQAGFTALTRHLKRDGSIFAWVYGRENNGWVVGLVNPLRTLVTSRLPRRAVYYLAWVLTVLLHPLLKTVYSENSPRWLRRALPYDQYMTWLSRYGFRHNHSVVFDHLVPSIAHYIRREDFERWFSDAGLELIDLSARNANSWRGHGRPRVV